MSPYLVIAVIVYLVWTKIAVVPFWLLANAHGNRLLDVRLLPKSRRISSPLFLTAWHGSGFDDCVGSFGTSGKKERKTVFFCNCSSLHNVVKDRLSIFIVHFTRNFNPQPNPIFFDKNVFPKFCDILSNTDFHIKIDLISTKGRANISPYSYPWLRKQEELCTNHADKWRGWGLLKCLLYLIWYELFSKSVYEGDISHSPIAPSSDVFWFPFCLIKP